MDENGSLLFPEQEISSPSPQTELNEPSPQAELPSLPRPAEEYFVERRGSAEDGGEKKKGTSRRLIRYVATTAAAVGLLAGASAPAPAPTPAPIEYVETESHLEIECAVILPDEPELLRYSYHGTDPLTGASDSSLHFYIVDPDGTETEFSRYDISADAEHSRFCYIRFDDHLNYESNRSYKLFSYEEDYSVYRNNSDWVEYGDIGFYTSLVPIAFAREGSTLKLVHTYQLDGVYYRTVVTRKIGLLSSEPEISVSLETEPLGDGLSQAHFRAVVHPREGDEHVYCFGMRDQLLAEHPDLFGARQPADRGELIADGRQPIYYLGSFNSFCVRWYDAEHHFLHEGWEYVMPIADGLHYPELSHEGRDFIITYDGLVQSSSPNEDAAFYSLELNLVDVSTGWHYLIETEQVPITD